MSRCIVTLLTEAASAQPIWPHEAYRLPSWFVHPYRAAKASASVPMSASTLSFLSEGKLVSSFIVGSEGGALVKCTLPLASTGVKDGSAEGTNSICQHQDVTAHAVVHRHMFFHDARDSRAYQCSDKHRASIARMFIPADNGWR